MKKIIIIITFLFSIFSNLSGQWEILNEGFKGGINTIDFVNENVGWIAGSNGTLLKTTDGGENWNSILINENWRMNKIDFINEFIGWAIGSTPTDPNWTHYIWKTSNGGNTWVQQFSSTVISFYSLYAIDENNVYTIGGNNIFKTTNGGTDWGNISPNLPDRNYNSLWFQDSQTGVVVGNYYDGTVDRGIILRTTNAGTSWGETVVNEFNSINDLQFLDNTNGYFRAQLDTSNFICKTEDMFSSWTVKTQYPYSITSYQHLDESNVYAIMGDSISSNNIMKSSNGGGNWQKVQTLSFESLKIYFSSPDQGFVLSNLFIGRFSARGVLYKNLENSDWVIHKFYYPLNDVSFINENKGIICGGYSISHGAVGGIFVTDDGGITWKVKYDTWDIFRSCSFVNEIQGFSLTTWSSIYKTTDSGNSWNISYENNNDSTGFDYWGNDIHFTNDGDGLVVGRYGDSLSSGAGILITTDLGETWHLEWQFPDTTNYGYNLKSIHFTETTGWSVGDGGMVLKYTSQSGWVKQTSVTDLPLNKQFFSENDYGWIAGGYENENDFQKILLKTIDGGVNWNILPNVPYLIRDLAFIDNNLGWAIGYDVNGTGGILKTTNGGINWIIDTGNLPAKLNALNIKDNYGWAVGENGLILRTTDAGTVWVEDDDYNTYPTEFVLEQNYPNPFNPTTVISYRLPVISKVTLKVYDVLGREVATLVNEEQPTGNYKVEFSGKTSSIQNLPAGRQGLVSGVYLYQLKAGNYISTKKMLLIK